MRRLFAAFAVTALVLPPTLTATARASTALGTAPLPVTWSIPARSSTPIRLDGAMAPQIAKGKATRLGPYNASQTLSVMIGLYPPHMAQEQQFLQQVQDRQSPLFHHFLTADQWNARFAPSAADEQAVVDWATSQGLTVAQRWANRLMVRVTAPVSSFERAFNVQINSYRFHGETDFAADRAPLIPARLSNVVQSVMGLDNLVKLQPTGLSSVPAQAARLASATAVSGTTTIRDQGIHPNVTGPHPNITNGYLDPADLLTDQAYAYDPLRANGYCCNPLNQPNPTQTGILIAGVGTVTDADLQGFAQQYPYLSLDLNNIQRFPLSKGLPSGDANSRETTLDTEYAAMMSSFLLPSSETAHVDVYEAPDASTASFVTEFQDMIGGCNSNTCPPTAQFLARTVSMSFVAPEDLVGSSALNAMDGVFSQLVGMGFTLVAAAGDNGAYADCSSTPNVDWPASDPNVVAAGGTTLSLNGGGQYGGETAWSGGSGGVCSSTSNAGGGGGGCSATFGMPDYQSADGITACYKGATGYFRAVPDISLNAGSFQNAFFNGSLIPLAGTSVVAPELAGFFAQENAWLLHEGSICGFNGAAPCAPLGDADYAIYFAAGNRGPHNPFYDITSGCDSNSLGNGYCAGPGYDLATGWGSADMLQLAWALNYYNIADSSAPTVSFSGPSANRWYNTDQTVNFTTTDTGGGFPPSGVDGYNAAWDADYGDASSEPSPGQSNPGAADFYDGPSYPLAQGFPASNQLDLAAAGQGCHTAEVRVWDNEGQSSGAQSYGPVCYDTIPPTVSSITFNPPSGSTASSVQIDASAGDPGAGSTGSGIARIDYYVNTAADGSASGAWNLIGSSSGASGSVTWNTAGYASGTHLVKVYPYDNAGNCDCSPSSTDNEVQYTVTVPAPTATNTPIPPTATPCPSGVILSTSNYAQTVLADQPQGFWRLDQPCPFTVSDVSGHGLNGQVQGSVFAGQSGPPTGDGDVAMTFDGSTGYIALGDPAALQPSQVSVEAWVKTSTTTGAIQYIVRKRLYGYGLFLNGGGQPAFDINDSSGNTYQVHSQTSIADGQWHYLVGTYDGANVRIYVDGALARTATAGAIYYQPDAVAIGRDGGASDGYFTGSLADVAIYGTALSTAQVQAHLAAASSPTATPTSTAVPPTSTSTNTAVPSTDTPTATNTAAPTNTPTATDTAVPPTDTPTATDTPVPPTATATNTPQPSAVLVSSAASGVPYQSIAVTGTNFGAAEAVNISLDSAGTPPLTSTTTTAAGSFVARLALPQTTGGAHQLIAVGQSSGLTATVALTVKPETVVAHATGVQGSSNTLMGFGFGAGEPVKAYWYPGLLPLGSTTTNALGSFASTTALSVTVPISPAGTYYVISIGQRSKAMGISAVTVLPALIVKPTSGARGSAATVIGTGLKANEAATLLWDCSTSTCASTTVLNTQPVHANANGDLGVSVTIPTTATLGLHAVGVKGSSGTFATTSYTVTS